MALVWTSPAAVNTAAVLARMQAAKIAAELAAAEALLAISRPLVPWDTKELQNSGTAGHDAAGGTVTYTRLSTDGTYNVAVRMHEDHTLNHPNGGEANYLGGPMRTAHHELETILGHTVAETFR